MAKYFALNVCVCVCVCVCVRERERERQTEAPLETPNGRLCNYAERDWIKRTTEDATKRITSKVLTIPSEVIHTTPKS